MSGDEARRRSSRKRTTTPRYVDNITPLDLGSSDGEQVDSPHIADDPDDVDFDGAADAEPDLDEEPGDEDGDSEGDLLAAGDVREVDGDADGAYLRQKTTKAPKKRIQKTPQAGEEILPRMKPKVTRGLKNIPRHDTRRMRIEHTFGRSDEDLLPYLKNRDTWQNDFTLPSYFAPSFYHTDSMREKETTEGWRWYTSDGGRDAFDKHQIVQTLDGDDVRQYLPSPDPYKENFVLGPLKDQKMFSLGFGASMSLKQAWPTSIDKPGFILNVGARVQSMDWLPNNNNDEQYLAIATLAQEPHSRGRPAEEKLKSAVSPAFTASPPYPTSIQIWRVSRKKASLNTVLCIDWGDPKQIAWCPMPGPAGTVSTHGLLASIFFDGSIRVFDITLNSKPSPQHVRIRQSAFSCVLPEGVVPTNVAWLSAQSLAVSCSNGHVAVFNLATHLSGSANPPARSPRPWLYHPFHMTYILALTSCYPSHPHLLITSSLDGTLRLTDLRNPHSDTTSSPRSRVGTAALAWHDRLQSAISVDELGVVRTNTLRRFFQTAELGKVSAQAGDVKTSPLHGAVLTGGLDGRAFVSGPMRRVSNVKKAEVWRQCWFEFSWRRGLAERQVEVLKADGRRAQGGDDEDDGGSGGRAQPDDRDEPSDLAHLRQPLSRFLDGHKLEQVVGPGVVTQKYALTHHTVYEEQSAITQVAWNPNVEFGGWAAAGTGSGLVRIEDLTLKREEDAPESRTRAGRKG